MHARILKYVAPLGFFSGFKLKSSIKVNAKSNEPKLPVFDLTSIRLEADALYSQFEIKNLYARLENLKRIPEVEIQWRRARAIREFSKSPDKSKQESDKLLLYALDAAKYALELDPDHWAANKWYGILLGDTADIEGIQKLLECSEAIKFHFEKSIENFKDPTTIYCLGMWHFRFTDLPWHRRKLAALYFGVKIPDSTYEDALRYFLLAEETEPLFYDRNQLMIGVCYHRLNQQELALEHFTKVKYWIKANHESDAYDEAIAYIEQLIK